MKVQSDRIMTVTIQGVTRLCQALWLVFWLAAATVKAGGFCGDVSHGFRGTLNDLPRLGEDKLERQLNPPVWA